MKRITPRSIAAAVILCTFPLNAQPVHCFVVPDDEPVVCHTTGPESFSVARQSLSKASFNNAGLGAVCIEGRGFYFVTRRGNTAPALPFDNGADRFAEGLARTRMNGKVGFVHRRLQQVIAPVWDFAYPFQSGIAAVCAGWGRWGYIDKHGEVVVPVIYSLESLPPPETARKGGP